MSEFDDPDLGRRLRSAAGSEPDVLTAHDTVLRQVRRVRRRRTAVLSGAAVVLLVGLGTVAARGPGESPAPLGTTSATADTSEPEVTDSSTLVDTSSTLADTTSSATSTPATPTPVTDPSTPSSASALPTSPSSSITPPPPPTEPSTSSSVAPTAPPTTQSFSCTGGSITVQLVNGQLQLVATAPAAGFVVDEQEVHATELEVRFQSAGTRSKVSVKVVGGAMQQQPCEDRDEAASDAESDTEAGHD